MGLLLRLLRILFGAPGRRTPYRAYRPRSDARITRRLARTETLRIRAVHSETLLCGTCWVVDGDTIIIDNVHLRLAGIDAPELDHPFGQQAKWALVKLCKGQRITARLRPDMSYDRLVAECTLPDGSDLAAELVRMGLALDWPRFSGGKYTHLEVLGVRKKLWRCDARQRGRVVV